MILFIKKIKWFVCFLVIDYMCFVLVLDAEPVTDERL